MAPVYPFPSGFGADFFFSAFSESWKTQSEGDHAATWGLFLENGRIRPALVSVLNSVVQGAFKLSFDRFVRNMGGKEH